jgi:flagellar basal body-associated protein FliL
MIKRIAVILMVLAVFLMAGCSAAATPSYQAAPTYQAAKSAPESAAGGAQSDSNTNPNLVANQAADARRIVIMNASLSIVVKDPGAAMEAIDAMAKSMGGFVVSSNLSRSLLDDGTEVPAAKITVRVPAEKLTQALDNIKSLVADRAKDILTEDVTGQDVTKEYTDLNSQLVNLQRAEKQLQAILDTATKTEDVLSIFNQLTQIRSQIEVIQGQIKYYEDAAAMSAVTVALRATASMQPISIGGWQPAGVARDAIQTLINFARFVVDALIWITLFCLPVILVLGLPLYFMIRGFMRWRKARKAASVSTGQPKPAA